MWFMQFWAGIALAWTEVQVTALSSADDKSVTSSGVTFDGTQKFWIAYSVYDTSATESKVYLKSYDLSTNTLSSSYLISNTILNGVFPNLAVTTDGDVVYVAFSGHDTSCDADTTPAGKVIVVRFSTQTHSVLDNTVVWDSSFNGGDNDCTQVGRKTMVYDSTDDEVHLCWTAKSALDQEVYCSDLSVGSSWSTVNYLTDTLDVNTTEENDHPGVCVDLAAGGERVTYHDVDDSELWVGVEDSPTWTLGQFSFTNPDNGLCWEGEDGYGEVWNDHANPQQIHFSDCLGGYVTDCIDAYGLWTEADQDPAEDETFDKHLFPDVTATSDRWWVSWDATETSGMTDVLEEHVAYRCENDTDWILDDPFVSTSTEWEEDERFGFPHIATGVWNVNWWVGVPIRRHLVGGLSTQSDLWFSFRSESGLSACP